ncbi:MAG TPA: peroxiredoxin [Solirubrobacterales bacterium]|nr:peroxiredoxin [Solirubrobacterales bacterium]
MAKVDVGDVAPDFELPGTGGKTYKLSDLQGKNVVLAFYPGDETRVCTAQFCSYRDNGDQLDQLDAEVLGISSQSVDSHEHWAQEKSLNVPLLADEDLAVSKSYGVTGWVGPLGKLAGLKETAPGGRYVMRSIFVIDGEGIVRYRHVSRTGSTFQTVDDLEQAVAALA